MPEKKPRQLSETILKISDGILCKAVDLVLFWVYLICETGPLHGGSIYKSFSRVERDFDQFDSGTLKNALKNSVSAGWLDNNLRLTDKGWRKLSAVLPIYDSQPKEWDGVWHIVSYDIPEKKRRRRDILRGILLKLGFGPLHKSLWICPYNFLDDVEKIAKRYEIADSVLLAEANRLGKEPSRVLADKVWRLKEINQDYQEYIQSIRKKELTKHQAAFGYLSILKRDPQLPDVLLPDNWLGREAYEICCKLVGKRLYFGKKIR